MSLLSGQSFQPGWEMKARLILQAGVFLILFYALFFYFYRKHFWGELEHRRLFFWTIGILAPVIIGKFAIFYFAKGYIPDHMLFFAVPSPKFSGWSWLLPVALSLGIFWRFYQKMENWTTAKFLAVLWIVFILFSVGVAGFRDGSLGIYEPFTRSQWDYAGDLPLVKSIPQFLRDYASLNPKLSVHGSVHPPGNVLVLYILQKIFKVDFLGLAMLVTGIGGAFVFPVYYFWRQFIPEAETRKLLSLFIFIPSIVMFSATSMDAIMMTFSWLALSVSFWGWKKGGLAAFIGGVLAGIALLMHFLFLLFGIVFLSFLVYLYQRADIRERLVIVKRAIWSLFGFLAFNAFLYFSTGYSVAANFFVAKSIHYNIAEASAPAVSAYLLFAFTNIFAFSFYFGISNIILFLWSGNRELFRNKKFLASIGFCAVFFFVLSGIFQGEVERLWLFLIPLFILPVNIALERSGVQPPAVISLLIFQIVTMQTLFYTYW